ncbi:MAG: hypothetical protein AB1916_02180 [Thermodesulfobacteriota bacterium]
MSDAPAAASAYALDDSRAVNQPAFAMGAALRAPDGSGGEDVARGRGDTVVISELGRNMAARQAQAQESSPDESREEGHIRQIKERIARLKQEIEKLQQDQSLSEDEKRRQILAKQSELAELQTQLQEAYEAQAKAASAAGQSGGMTSLGSHGARP